MNIYGGRGYWTNRQRICLTMSTSAGRRATTRPGASRSHRQTRPSPSGSPGPPAAGFRRRGFEIHLRDRDRAPAPRTQQNAARIASTVAPNTRRELRGHQRCTIAALRRRGREGRVLKPTVGNPERSGRGRATTLVFIIQLATSFYMASSLKPSDGTRTLREKPLFERLYQPSAAQ